MKDGSKQCSGHISGEGKHERTACKLSKSILLPADMELTLTMRSLTLLYSKAVSKKGASTFTAHVSSKPSSVSCFFCAKTPALQQPKKSSQKTWCTSYKASQCSSPLERHMNACSLVDEHVYVGVLLLDILCQLACLSQGRQIRTKGFNFVAASGRPDFLCGCLCLFCAPAQTQSSCRVLQLSWHAQARQCRQSRQTLATACKLAGLGALRLAQKQSLDRTFRAPAHASQVWPAFRQCAFQSYSHAHNGKLSSTGQSLSTGWRTYIRRYHILCKHKLGLAGTRLCCQ